MLSENKHLFIRIINWASLGHATKFKWDKNSQTLKLLEKEKQKNANKICYLHTLLTIVIVLQTVVNKDLIVNGCSTTSKVVIGVCVSSIVILNDFVRVCNRHFSELALCINGFIQLDKTYQNGKYVKTVHFIQILL